MSDLHIPPLASLTPPAGGRLGPEPEHFIVEEIPLYEASGEGEHLYVFVEKRGETTQQLIRAVARAAGVRPQDVGSAGMKDRHAITRQWLSLPATARPPAAWHLPDFASTLAVTRHKNKLRTGHLSANRFRITLVDVPEGGQERAEKIVSSIGAHGLPNYFGAQRFGRQGQNLGQALQWLRQGNDAHGEASREGRRRNRHKNARFENKLLSSVIQSEIFNRYATLRGEQAAPLLLGEVVRLAGSSRLFVVEDVAEELPRLEQKDIFKTGPMPGPRTVQARHQAAELELTAAEPLGLSSDDMSRLGQEAPGTRRDLVMYPEELEVTSPEQGHLVVSFVLPAGSYATQLIREITGGEWLEARNSR